MSLWRFTPRAVTQATLLRINAVRSVSFLDQLDHKANLSKEDMHGPKPHSDLHLPGNPKGYLKYIHNWSGQNMYSRHDNFFGLLIGKTLEKRESYMFGLWGALAFIHVIGALVIYYSFMKIDVWVNKSSKDAPWTWERSHDNYYKYHTIAYDPHHRTHQHLPELEILEDQMAEAARKRGTRH